MKQIDINAIGNVVVDKFFFVNYLFLEDIQIKKGSMTLVNWQELEYLEKNLPQPKFLLPGGSSSNTILGCSKLGSNTGFLGVINNDEGGEFYYNTASKYVNENLIKINHSFKRTASCFVFITPDHERTMLTYLGVNDELETHLSHEIWLALSKILLVEGFLCGTEKSFESAKRSIQQAKKSKACIALTLGDSSFIKNNFWKMKQLMKNADIILGTVQEGLAITKKTDIHETIYELRQKKYTGGLTDGANGAYVFSTKELHHIPAQKIENIIDTTGAGDQFAAGFLHGVANNLPLIECGKLGVECASIIIQKLGSFPL